MEASPWIRFCKIEDIESKLSAKKRGRHFPYCSSSVKGFTNMSRKGKEKA
jgi:hypothetical protein